LCRDLEERVNDVPLPIMPTVPTVPHLRSAGPVNVYEQAVAAAAAATEDAERIADIKTQLELHAHELEVLRGAVFERFEDLFDEEREKVLKKHVDCCFRDLKELQVEVNHRIWSGRLRQPLHQLGKERKDEREDERGGEGDPSVPARDVVMDMDMDMDLNMGAQFQLTEWPEFTDEEIMAMFKEMEEELLDEPVDWEEILKAEAKSEEAQLTVLVKREPEDDEMQLDDAEGTKTVKGGYTKDEEIDGEEMEKDVDMKEPEEST
ncbi:hypothetical protein N0V85_009479, partial [Neurospora sp. IMI 360204]